jgi:hypothetical protein
MPAARFERSPPPGGADGDADAGDQGGKGGGLYPAVTEDCHHQHYVQGYCDEVADVAHQCRIYLLLLQHLPEQPSDQSDQPAAHEPEYYDRQHLDSQFCCVTRNYLLVMSHGFRDFLLS